MPGTGPAQLKQGDAATLGACARHGDRLQVRALAHSMFSSPARPLPRPCEGSGTYSSGRNWETLISLPCFLNVLSSVASREVTAFCLSHFFIVFDPFVHINLQLMFIIMMVM